MQRDGNWRASHRAPGWKAGWRQLGLALMLLPTVVAAGEPELRPTELRPTEMRPSDALTQVLSLHHQDRPYESLVRLESLVESSPTFVPAALALIEQARRLERLPELRDWLEALMAHEGPSPERWEALSELHTALGQPEKALDAAWQAHRLDCPDWHCMQTLVYAVNGPAQSAALETTLQAEAQRVNTPAGSESTISTPAPLSPALRRQQAGLAQLGLGLLALGQSSQWERSLEAFERACDLLDAPVNRAAALSYRVYVLRLLGRAEEAAALAMEAESLHRALGDRENEIQALKDRVEGLGALGQPRDQLDPLQRLVSLHRSLSDGPSEVSALLYLSSVQQALGDLTEAKAAAASARERNATFPQARQTPLAPLRQAQLLLELGQTPEALTAVEEAIALAQAQQDSPEQRQALSRALNTRARIHEELGYTELTLRDYDQALLLARADDNAYVEAILLQNQGDLLWRLGDLASGLRRMEEALRLVQQKGRAFPDRGLEGALQNNLGEYHLKTGDLERARQAFSAAQQLSLRLGDPHTRAISRRHLALVEFTQRTGDWGQDNAERALSRFQQEGSLLQTGLSLTLLGRIQVAKGALDAGIEQLRQAQTLFASRQLKRYEADVWSVLSQAYAATGQKAQALHSLEQAVTLYRALRGWMVNPALESRFFASHAEIYAQQVRLLLADLPEATLPPTLVAQSFALGEEARSQSFQRWLDTTQSTTLDDLPPELVTRYRLARQQLNQARDFLSAPQASLDELLALRALTPEPAPPSTAQTGIDPPGESAVEVRLQQLSRLRQQREEAFLEVEGEVQRALAQQRPPVPTVTVPPQALLERVQARLDERTVVLAFLLGPEQSYLWRVQRNAVHLRLLPPEAELASQVQVLRQSLAQSQSAVPVIQARATRLTQTLFGDALRGLPPDARLLILPDRSLTGLPFEALTLPHPTPEQPPWLGGAYAITYLTTLQTLLGNHATEATTRRTSLWEAPWLLLGDAAYDRDDCGPGAHDGPTAPPSQAQYARLCFSGQEVKGIAKTHGGWPGAARTDRVLTREQATRANLLDADLPTYSVLHFATHGISSSEQPIRSGLVLSRAGALAEAGAEAGAPARGSVLKTPREDRFLDFNEIRGWRLHASLVVLSACDTAEGNFQAGEGIQSLAQAFRLAGSRQVIGSHWQVSDASTAQLMQAFYSHLKRVEVAEALRQARRKLMAQPAWSHPYYWAAFGLME